MSSRNRLLKDEDREKAPYLYKVLRTAVSPASAKAELEDLGFRVDYIEEHWGRRFGAAHLGSVRLIDNVEI
jgi:pantoate--beta-alanine ligase